MASSKSCSLKALVVFRNVLYPDNSAMAVFSDYNVGVFLEFCIIKLIFVWLFFYVVLSVFFVGYVCFAELIRSVHMYQLKKGVVDEQVEREYVFNKYSAYEETGLYRVLTLEKFELSKQHEGKMNGVWLCIYVFDANCHCPPNLDHVPSLISITKNPKLASIPTLANDLEIIFQLGCGTENGEPSQITPDVIDEQSIGGSFQFRSAPHMFPLDLNLPYPEPENEESDQGTAGTLEKKKKRATPRDVARLSLADIVKYFDLPIIEASKNLKVGVTALKKKCRELGIPRWPHRKIKSLDTLIRDLQEEFVHQQQEDEDAALLVAKTQRMLESEKESIEREPCMEIRGETKKFRQDIFKRRHRARARENHIQTMSLF
ncbi:protein RKD5 [Cornus florida]|uniref:protein RKD5 n=1 Tax=Cornus florida TaxID=4283 RepID=UPI00289C7030|nr:protein RKD5 [Cornus florida]